jgi:hypothetical protein
MEKFSELKVTFTLKDVGSKIIDQLSTDIYTGPGSIIRELVKNAYDSYLSLEALGTEPEDGERQIVISRLRESSGVGKLWIADKGVGQDLNTLKGNVQISISTKPDDLQDATGFRGLGSWAVLGAGSQITITSTRLDEPWEFKLVINVRRIYEILSPGTTLDDVLNNPKCISFSQAPAAKEEHGTTVEILCDGPTEVIRDYELNRLHALTDPQDLSLKKLLVESCPIPYANDGGVYKKIQDVYRQAKYYPTPIVLDGTVLTRRLPDELTEFTTSEINIGGSLAALTWVVENPQKTGEVSRFIDEDQHLLGGTSVQLMRFNVPIGHKGIFADPRTAGILRWYVGEIHILAGDVLPNANGQDLRAGMAREAFVEGLKHFYQRLEQRGEQKSAKISFLRKLAEAEEGAKRLRESTLSEREKTIESNKIVLGVQALEKADNRRKAKTEEEKELRQILNDPAVADARRRVKKLLSEEGHMLRYRSKATKVGAARGHKPDRSKASASESYASPSSLSMELIQARLGRAIPKFKALGLSTQQIEGVFKLFQAILAEV